MLEKCEVTSNYRFFKLGIIERGDQEANFCFDLDLIWYLISLVLPAEVLTTRNLNKSKNSIREFLIFKTHKCSPYIHQL